MTTDRKTFEIIRSALAAEAAGFGLPQGADGLHSWRCEYPDVYGACECFDEFVTECAVAIASRLSDRA